MQLADDARDAAKTANDAQPKCCAPRRAVRRRTWSAGRAQRATTATSKDGAPGMPGARRPGRAWIHASQRRGLLDGGRPCADQAATEAAKRLPPKRRPTGSWARSRGRWHADDAFASKALGLTVYGASEQVASTGANLAT
ncbi:MAG: hypothetical protein ACLUE1_01495 [Adlercreutzia equolifaciens]